MNTIKVIHAEDAGTYEIKLPYGDYEINGTPFKVASYQSNTVVEKSLPTIKKVITKTFVEGYLGPDGLISTDLWSKIEEDLQKKGYYDEDNEGWFFEDLDDEYAYKKFLKLYEPEYKTEISTEDVSLEIEKARLKHPSPYVTCLYSIGGEPHLAVVDITAIEKEYFIELCKDAQVTYEIPNHSHLEFAKVNGKYAFNSGWNDKRPSVKVPFDSIDSTIEDCKKRVRNVVYAITTPLMLASTESLRDAQTLAESIFSNAQSVRYHVKKAGEDKAISIKVQAGVS